MSQKELNRIPVLQQVCDKLLTQSAAAKLLNICVRQLQRVLVRYLSYGAAGIVSRKRGMPANNRAPDALKLQEDQFGSNIQAFSGSFNSSLSNFTPSSVVMR